MKAVMIDLETMSSHMDAAIVAIGAVTFDPYGPLLDMLSISTEEQPATCFYTNVQLQSCIDIGLKVSGDTVTWWLQQSQEARDAINSAPAPITIWSALYRLSIWIEEVKPEQVWAHANFDLSILDSAYKACGRSKVPWKYYRARDVRTIYDLAYPDEKVPGIPDTNKHHALYDAARQAIGVQTCYKKLGFVGI